MTATRQTIKGYREHNAHRDWLKPWVKAGQIELVWFPYDPNSLCPRRTLMPACGSAATWKDMNLTWEQPGNMRWDDFTPSDKFQDITAILGSHNHADILHIDSAYKSACKFFLTCDMGDIIRNRERLRELLGISFFHPDDQIAIEAFFAVCGLAQPAP